MSVLTAPRKRRCKRDNRGRQRPRLEATVTENSQRASRRSPPDLSPTKKASVSSAPVTEHGGNHGGVLHGHSPTISTLPSVPQPIPAPESGEQQAVTPHQPEQQAAILWRTVVPSLMTMALGVDGQVRAPGCRVLLDRVIANVGDPDDSIEVMMVEQLTMAHYRAAQLQCQAAEAKSIDAAQIYNTAAARLLAEFRKTAMALQEYRQRALSLARAEREAAHESKAACSESKPGDQHARKSRHQTRK